MFAVHVHISDNGHIQISETFQNTDISWDVSGYAQVWGQRSVFMATGRSWMPITSWSSNDGIAFIDLTNERAAACPSKVCLIGICAVSAGGGRSYRIGTFVSIYIYINNKNTPLPI